MNEEIKTDADRYKELSQMYFETVKRLMAIINKQPQIIRCGECASYQSKHHWCALFHSDIKPTDFCSYAERRIR